MIDHCIIIVDPGGMLLRCTLGKPSKRSLPMRVYVSGLILAAVVSCATAPAKTEVGAKRDDPVMLEKRREGLQRKSLERTNRSCHDLL